ncbi:MAG: C4-dicarboxylate ABC transporter permease [Firmicutes bacterium]|nr:C4-dicarboxylate ABC transporter permease [Bacillota bacterium]
MIKLLLQGFADFFSLTNFLYMALGLIVGVAFGALPGLGGASAMILLMPLTFGMQPVSALILLLAAYKGAMYGGSISAILIGTPGTPQAALTVADGNALAKKGQGIKALKVSLIGSTTGDLFSDIVLVFGAFQLARIALKFGSPETAIVAIIALLLTGAASGKTLSKGILSCLFGVFASMIGLDPITALPRLTFGSSNLMDGIQLVPMMMGFLAFSQLCLQMDSIRSYSAGDQPAGYLPPPKEPSDTTVTREELKLMRKPILCGSIAGTIIGILPGLGPTLGAIFGYDLARRVSKNPSNFGKGSIEGIAGAESGNSAVSGANLVPLLGLGIPGDVGAAILVAAFLMLGFTPGPLIFQEAPNVIFSVYAGMILSNLALLVIGWVLVKYLVRLAQTPVSLLFPVIMVLLVAGVYTTNQNIFDLWVMLFFGVLGYIMAKTQIPRIPFVIGFILGPILESNLTRALIISRGSWSVFFKSTLAIVLWIICGLLAYLIYRQRRKTVYDETEVSF